MPQATRSVDSAVATSSPLPLPPPQWTPSNNVSSAAVFPATSRSATVSWNAAATTTMNRRGDDDTRRDKRRRRQQKVVNCCKQLIAFLFSHIGLAGMVVAYSILGGFLFRAIEAPHELEVKVAVGKFKRDKIDEISRLHETHVGGENFTRMVRIIFGEFQRKVVEEVKLKGWDGKDYDNDDEAKLQWSFAGALLYAVTVVTTIGYGHIAPKTNLGRMITILYALIGIPLTFLYLSNIGNFLADCFRLFYRKICCDVCCCQKCERERKREKLKIRRRREVVAAATQRNVQLMTSRSQLTAAGSSVSDNVAVARGRRPTSAQTVPKSRLSSSATKPSSEMTSFKSCNELRPEVVSRRRSPKPSIGSSAGAESSISGIPSSPVTSSSSAGGGLGAYENMRETDILGDENAPPYDVTSVIDRKRPRLETEVTDVEQQQRKMFVDFINSKETDLTDAASPEPEARDIVVGTLSRDSSQNRQQRSQDAAIPEGSNKTVVDDNRTRRRRTDQPVKVKSKSVGCVDAPRNLNIEKSESQANINATGKERQRFFRKRKDEPVTTTARGGEVSNVSPNRGLSINTPESSTAAVATGSSESNQARKPRQGRTRSKLSDGRASAVRSFSPSDRPLIRSETLVKWVPEHEGQITGSAQLATEPVRPKGSVKVKRSATFGSPDVNCQSADTTGSSRPTGSALLRRVRQQLTPRLSVRRPLLRKGSLNDSSVSLSGRGADLHGSEESFVTACGDSAFDIDRVCSDSELPRYDVTRAATSIPRPAVGAGVSGCPTNSDNNVSGADDSEQAWLPPPTPLLPSDNATKSFRSFDNDAESNRDLLASFQVVDDVMDDPFELDELHRHQELQNEAKVSVPISICVIIIAVYVVAGSALFAVWEGWDYLTGSYFCFITLSTIGFGDVVPGTDMDQWASHEKLVLCALWLAFGLSLLAMCFNLMQEEVKEKCKWIGRKLGLLKDEEVPR